MQLNTIHNKILKPEFRKCVELATPTEISIQFYAQLIQAETVNTLDTYQTAV